MIWLSLTVLPILLALVYAGLMLVYGLGWRSLPAWNLPANFVPVTRVSVIIPARNEAKRIGPCLEAILAGNYPPDLLEIIVVDDHSEDATAEVALDFSRRYSMVRLLSLAEFSTASDARGAYKKRALEIAIAQAGGDLIVTTDADCLAGPQWLPLLVSVFQTRPQVQVLTAPVNFHQEKTLFERFQSLDLLGLMGITGAGIHSGFQRMGNGANLAYRKAVFTEVGGYAGNRRQASGDDMFLIQQVAARYPAGVFFLKNKAATVYATAEPDLRAFWQQRLRWGQKNAALPEWPIRLALGAVFLFCWSIIILLLALPFAPASWPVLLFQLAAKATADYLLLRMLCRYFGRTDLLGVFWPAFFLHTGYIAVVGAGSLVFKRFVWKGRQVR